ncbi:synaptonemal complex protein 1-like [Nymphaea colorata]|uniref:synaptonemal complex protein 1-like n=1 Tax=Nymphaea colorata TaxID=210225 RepID=UPI00129D4933|nr:synaptonemal complex protein 1-like [Nymphaea colorata]
MASPRGRGRPYGVMLLLAFAAAAVGVMAVQKLRERRVYTILINEKHREVMALNMRYQREKDLSSELKVKIEDLKAKIVSLRKQKFELKSKLVEMQSLTTSLQEKHRALGAEVEEKQKQIENLSRRKGLSRKMYMQLIALREILKHKEDEIHELKHQNANMPSEHSAGSNETASFRSNVTAIRSVLDRENGTDRVQGSASRGQRDEHTQNPQDGERPRQGDQSKGISRDSVSSTKGQPANVEAVNKEQGNETIQDVNADKQTEHARRGAVKREVNVNAGDMLSLHETSQAAHFIQMPVDISNDTVDPRAKVQDGDVKALEKRQTENAETSQVETNENTRSGRETVTLLAGTGQPRQPNISQDTAGERQAEHKREHIDRPAEALPDANIISELQNSIKTIKVNQSDVQAADDPENIKDSNAQQHQQKDKSVDSKGLENGGAAHAFRQPEHVDDSNGEVQKSNPETEVTNDAEEDDDGDAFDEALDDIPEDERRDTEPENYQDDKGVDEVSEM